MSMICISQHLIRTSLILRSGGHFLTPTGSITCSIIRSLVIVTITWNQRREQHRQKRQEGREQGEQIPHTTSLRS